MIEELAKKLEELKDEKDYRWVAKQVLIFLEKKLPSVFDANEDVISAVEYKKKLRIYD